MPARLLTAWYARAKRPMPWRTAPDPYRCWLSEIMMQQTTYAQALPYYRRFLARFPDVQTLAAASEPAVLKCWAGLGYYARARNLHRAAKMLAADGWPSGAAAWAKVPGVGPYTAAALASVLDGERVPVVDGNVARVFARYWLLEDDFRKQPARERLAGRLAREMFAPRRRIAPGDLNQAMMELGALVCTPRTPNCAACPLRKDCQARKENRQADFPVRPARKPVPVRQATVTVASDGKGRVLLVRNDAGGLMKGLWELPALTPACRHVQTFSHFRLELSAMHLADGAAFVNPASVPLATATRRILEKCGLLPGGKAKG